MNEPDSGPDPASLGSPIKRVTIITVCRNAESFIAETMRSVLKQTAVLSGRAELEYLIQDGKSTDRTLEVVESVRTPDVTVASEPDSGLYDGLLRATQRCTGDVVAYLNAGDYYHLCALDVVMDIMECDPVPWLTGMKAVYNHRSHAIECSTPYLYRRRLIGCGMCGTFPRLAAFKNASDGSRIHHPP